MLPRQAPPALRLVAAAPCCPPSCLTTAAALLRLPTGRAACVAAVLKGHFSAVTSLSLSPDGWTLLSGGRDSVVIVWSLRDNSKVATVPVYEPLEGGCCAGAGAELAVVVSWQ